MIYVTSDTHGDISRLKGPEMRKIRRGDTLIVLGDFGFSWQGGPAEEKLLKKLGKKPYHLLFIDGCHENFDLLRDYPTVEYAGGRAKQISGRLHYLQKGEIYTIEQKRLLCFGGGESEDRDPEYEGKRWWRAELPTDIETGACAARLAALGGRVDYILTHDAPARLLRFMQQQRTETNAFQNYLDTFLDAADYKKWLFGRYHRDQYLSPKATAVYQKVLPLE